MICPFCHNECSVIAIDEGIGPYECWGFKGVDTDIVPASDCCHAQIELTDEEWYEIRKADE